MPRLDVIADPLLVGCGVVSRGEEGRDEFLLQPRGEDRPLVAPAVALLVGWLPHLLALEKAHLMLRTYSQTVLATGHPALDTRGGIAGGEPTILGPYHLLGRGRRVAGQHHDPTQLEGQSLGDRPGLGHRALLKAGLRGPVGVAPRPALGVGVADHIAARAADHRPGLPSTLDGPGPFDVERITVALGERDPRLDSEVLRWADLGVQPLLLDDPVQGLRLPARRIQGGVVLCR